MKKPLDTLTLSDPSSPYSQAYEQHKAKLAAMSDEEREAYWQAHDAYVADCDRRTLNDMQSRTVASRIASSGIPEEFRDASVEAFGKDIQIYARILVNGGTESLVITGQVGTRKTTAGCAILNRVVLMRAVRYVKMTTLVRKLNDVFVARDRTRTAIFEEYATVPLLMIDDLGKELTVSNPANTIALLWDLIDSRWAEHRPTIVTTQYEGQKLFSALVSSSGDTANAHAIVDRLKTYSKLHFEGDSSRPQGQLLLDL